MFQLYELYELYATSFSAASALCVTTTASEGVPRGDSGVFLSPVSSSFKASTPLSIDGASLAAQMGTPVVTVKVAFDGGADKLILPSIDERLSTFETLFDDDESDAEGDDDEKEASTSTGGKPVSADFVLIPPPPARSAVPSLPDKRSPLDITPCLASYPFPTHKGAPYPMFISSLGDHIVSRVVW